MRRDLVTEECCYTCVHNRNNFSNDFYCDCEFLGKGTPKQEAWCADYELDSDYKSKSGRCN